MVNIMDMQYVKYLLMTMVIMAIIMTIYFAIITIIDSKKLAEISKEHKHSILEETSILLLNDIPIDTIEVLYDFYGAEFVVEDGLVTEISSRIKD